MLAGDLFSPHTQIPMNKCLHKNITRNLPNVLHNTEGGLGEYNGLKSDGDVSPLNYATILGNECIIIVYVGGGLS